MEGHTPDIKIKYEKDHDTYKFVDLLTNDYDGNFINYWMPRQYVLTRQQLIDFDFDMEFGTTTLIALKDLKSKF